ncbi:hypothetical protein CTHBC1_1154 [Acetivibrio thermocellus BC1]|nr:hypothetical protein [Acetivibrio thermocellus]THJ76877.1 hypothetical protein EPD62_13880 [Acetivibrio thermocellus]CDG35804.1 hypothetical protein CTHBC1_1154 [Acetivibrio thermocellus BC1]
MKESFFSKPKRCVRVFVDKQVCREYFDKHIDYLKVNNLNLMVSRPKNSLKTIIDCADKLMIDGVLFNNFYFVGVGKLRKAYDTYSIEYYKHVKENLKNIADVRMRTLQFFRG